MKRLPGKPASASSKPSKGKFWSTDPFGISSLRLAASGVHQRKGVKPFREVVHAIEAGMR
jgi:hypothetical protein